MFFCLFLMIFSYFIITDFKFKSTRRIDDENFNKTLTNQNKIVNNLNDAGFVTSPSALEYLLFVWICSFLAEEVRQVNFLLVIFEENDKKTKIFILTYYLVSTR